LRVRAREFLNECDVTLRDSPENSSELKIHGSIIRRQRRPVADAFGQKHWALICGPPGLSKEESRPSKTVPNPPSDFCAKGNEAAERRQVDIPDLERMREWPKENRKCSPSVGARMSS